jgi:peptide deformylase
MLDNSNRIPSLKQGIRGCVTCSTAEPTRNRSPIDVAGAEEEQEPQRIVLINPEVIAKEGKQTGEEGCLSIPGFREPVSRAKKAVVRARDVKGEVFEITGEDLLARAFLHEIDHLNGILFINHLSALKRDLIKRRIKKLQKAGEWE